MVILPKWSGCKKYIPVMREEMTEDAPLPDPPPKKVGSSDTDGVFAGTIASSNQGGVPSSPCAPPKKSGLHPAEVAKKKGNSANVVARRSLLVAYASCGFSVSA